MIAARVEVRQISGAHHSQLEAAHDRVLYTVPACSSTVHASSKKAEVWGRPPDFRLSRRSRSGRDLGLLKTKTTGSSRGTEHNAPHLPLTNYIPCTQGLKGRASPRIPRSVPPRRHSLFSPFFHRHAGGASSSFVLVLRDWLSDLPLPHHNIAIIICSYLTRAAMFTATSLLLAGLLFETCFALDSDWAPFHPYTLAAARMDPLLFPGQVCELSRRCDFRT